MAQSAIHLLQRAMEGEELTVGTHLLPTELVIRDSCASPTAMRMPRGMPPQSTEKGEP